MGKILDYKVKRISSQHSRNPFRRNYVPTQQITDIKTSINLNTYVQTNRYADQVTQTPRKTFSELRQAAPNSTQQLQYTY